MPIPPDTLPERLRQAHLDLQAKVGRKVTAAELGEMLARYLGRADAFSAAAVSSWMPARDGSTANRKIPSLEVLEAFAALSGRSPAWIAWGEGKPPVDVSFFEQRTTDRTPAKRSAKKSAARKGGRRGGAA